MQKTSVNLSIVTLFQKYISETIKGKRLQKNGKMVASSTVQNYQALLRNIEKYSLHHKETILINTRYRYSKRNFDKERKYYMKFYKQFTDFLYSKGCTDNYVGLLIKTLRSFFIYLNESKGYETGLFYKLFYGVRVESKVVVFSHPQLLFLIKNIEFENSLPTNLKLAKDILVFGCTVGLRFSDLITLSKKNVERIDNSVYIIVTSKKTNTHTRIKLPDYAIVILEKYINRKLPKGLVFPKNTLGQFNNHIKRITSLAGCNHEVGKECSKRGIRKELMKDGKTYRFCDAELEGIEP